MTKKLRLKYRISLKSDWINKSGLFSIVAVSDMAAQIATAAEEQSIVANQTD